MRKKPESLDGLKFGHSFSDHMMEADWDYEKGWTHPIVSPLHDFKMHPGAKVSDVISGNLAENKFLGSSLRN